MDMELCADFIANRTGIDKETVKQVLKTETDYWMELDPSYYYDGCQSQEMQDFHESLILTSR